MVGRKVRKVPRKCASALSVDRDNDEVRSALFKKLKKQLLGLLGVSKDSRVRNIRVYHILCPVLSSNDHLDLNVNEKA